MISAIIAVKDLKKMDKRVRWKISAIIVLTVLILSGLGYLWYAGRSTSAGGKPAAATTTAATSAAVSDSPTPAPTPVPTPTPTAVPKDIDSNDSLQKLVNKANKLPADFVPSGLRVVNVKSTNEQQLREEAATALEAMFKAAEADNVYLKLISGYRSYAEQRSLYYTYLDEYGAEKTARMDAIPGASEHQLGLAADIGNWNGECELQSCFTSYTSYTWLQEHAHEYGFIERYPYTKEAVTGIMYSPWHWRYVGVDEATGIWKCNGWTMEEYYGLS